MLELRNKTRGASKPGYLVKAVRGGFEYAAAGDTPIGVVTQVVPSGMKCKIQTEGRAMIYVGETVQAGQQLRMKSLDEKGPAGQAFLVGDSGDYVSVGYAITHGRALIEVSLNIGSVAGGGLGGGVEEAPLTGSQYARQNAAWSIVSTGISEPAPDDIAYSRRNANWVNSNLVVDYSGGSGAQTAIVNYGERITFVGDTSWISTGYQFIGTPGSGVHEIEISLTPGALDTRWNVITAQGDDPKVRDIDDQIEIGNTSNVVFLSGTYTTVNLYRNTDIDFYNPTLGQPANELTVDINLTPLTGHYDTVYASLTDNATQTWVNNNFDDYVSWSIQDGPNHRAILAGDEIYFANGGDIQIQYDGKVGNLHTLTFEFVGSVGSMDRWYLNSDVDSPKSIQNDAEVVILGGTGITTSEVVFNTGAEQRWEMTINSNVVSSPWTADTNGITYTAGNVGIGIASSATTLLSLGSDLGEKLALYESGSTIYGLGVQANLMQIYVPTSSNRVGIGYGTSAAFIETLTVKGANVGINDSSPSYTLDVNGTIRSTSAIIATGEITAWA